MSSTKARIGLGMSGGADSSMAAYLLREAGHEVVGITLRLWHEPSMHASELHVQRAAGVAERLGIRHEILDCRDIFEERIVVPFVAAYRRGLTPSPCIRCNRLIKFGFLLEHALALGCERFATGHYARSECHRHSTILRRGLDPAKDQSYFLFELSAFQLRHACFPLGSQNKAALRTKAAELGLVATTQRESQDLCFIPTGDYGRFLVARHPSLAQPGSIVDIAGRRLGQHKGYIHYTIGQRRGLGLGGGPWYVVEVVPERNRVVVGRQEDLLSQTAVLENTNWICVDARPGTRLEVLVQLRYAMDPVPAVVDVLPDQAAILHFPEPVTAVTPGQAAVCYDGDRVLGGGWIRRSRSDSPTTVTAGHPDQCD